MGIFFYQIKVPVLLILEKGLKLLDFSKIQIVYFNFKHPFLFGYTEVFFFNFENLAIIDVKIRGDRAQRTIFRKA